MTFLVGALVILYACAHVVVFAIIAAYRKVMLERHENRMFFTKSIRVLIAYGIWMTWRIFTGADAIAFDMWFIPFLAAFLVCYLDGAKSDLRVRDE